MLAATSTAEQTKAFGAALADVVRPRDVVVLTGDLGAGKTTFVQGLGHALGVVELITSPTFTLHRRYQGRIELNHLDVYRLEQLEEVADLALPELLDRAAVTVIEWGDRVRPALPPDYLEIRFEFPPPGDGGLDDERRLVVLPVGASWAARQRRVGELIEQLSARTEGDGAC